MKREEYPVNAMRFNAAVEIQPATEEKPAQVKMLARSAQPIDHWFWGTIVHDNNGAKFKDSIPLDYNHDEVIGFANASDIQVDESGNLSAVGQLTPFREDDRASEVLHKSGMGVPYEASINFAGDGIKLERVPEGKSTEVNGYEFNGPGVVVREWPLRGIAVCPYGADGNTKSEFNSSDTVAVTILEGETLSDEKEVSEAVETPKETAPVETPAEAVELKQDDPRAEAKKFVEAFGAELGGQFYADGHSFEEAMTKAFSKAKERITELEAEVEHLSNSSTDPVPAPAEEEKPKGLAGRFNFASNN